MKKKTAKTKTPRAPQVTLEITHELIEDAVPRDSGHCMIAEAVKAAYPDASRIAVDLQTIRFTDPKRGLRYTYLTPRVAQIALIDFDLGVRDEPFSCRLRNGQVTSSGRRVAVNNQTPAQLKQRSEAAKKGHQSQALGRARLVTRKPSDGLVPDRIGGKTPPTTPFARRRAFGLRALER